MSKENWKLIERAESFAAGCSRDRLELRLVDALKASMAEKRALEQKVTGLEAVIAEAKKVAVGYILKVHNHPSQIIERLNRSPEAALRIKAESEARARASAEGKSDG